MTDAQPLETRFGLLVQNISDIITVLDIDGTIKYESPSTLRTLGFTPEQLVGHNAFEFIHPDDVSVVTAAMQQAISTPGFTVSPEFRFRHANGSWVYLEAIGNNLLHVPEVNGLVVTSRDVTARRALEAQLRQSQKMEAIGQLAGGIAHDFNNLLMIMRGSCELILSQMEPGDPSRRNAETLIRSADRAASLTQRLLSFSRNHVYSSRLLNLDTMARDSANMYRELLGSGIELDLVSSPEPIWVKADPTAIEQVIMNLVVNARDAMRGGGTLIIETACAIIDEDYSSKGKRIPPGCYAVLSLTDTGIGMDEHTQSLMFEPFFTTKQKGTGLGLAIVCGVVEQSGGHILASSAPGKGTKFEIYLPLVDQAPLAADLSQERGAPGCGTETILLAEDEDCIREIVQEFLTRMGYVVIAAKDGLEALRLAEQHDYEFDVLLTDVTMPGMSGSELARRMAANGSEPKVVYMTGHAEDSEMLSANLPKGKILLQKPFVLSTLAHTLNQILAPARSATSDEVVVF